MKLTFKVIKIFYDDKIDQFMKTCVVKVIADLRLKKCEEVKIEKYVYWKIAHCRRRQKWYYLYYHLLTDAWFISI